MRLKRPSVHVARAIDRALSGEMVKTLTPAARSVPCENQTLGARRPNSLVDFRTGGDGDGAPRHVKHAHKAKKPDALVLAFQQALLRNPAPGAFHPPPELAPAAAAGRNRRRAKMLMVRKKTKSYANAQGIKAVSTKRPLGVRKR